MQQIRFTNERFLYRCIMTDRLLSKSTHPENLKSFKIPMYTKRTHDRNRWTEGINTALNQSPSVVGREGTRGLFARAAIRAHATRNHAIRTLREADAFVSL